MTTQQLPGQIDPVVDDKRLATPLWYAWFLFAYQQISALVGAWISTFVPVVTAQTGGPPVGVYACRYRRVGKTINVVFDIQISNIAGSAGGLSITLPVGPAAAWGVLMGRDVVTSGKTVSATVSVGTSAVSVVNYDNTTVFVNGMRLIITGTYEVS